MNVFPKRVELTQEDLERGACMKLRKYLLAQGNPNALLPCIFSSAPGYEQALTVELSLLQKCCLEEDVSLTALLLDHEETTLESPPESSFPTPLHLAACWKRLRRRSRLVAPADENTLESGQDPAISFGNKTIAEALLRRGADPNGHADRFSLTPLHLALVNGNVDLVQSLLIGGADASIGPKMSLFCAAVSRCVGGLLALRSAAPALIGALISQPLDSCGRTILHIVCDEFFFDESCSQPDESMELWERQIYFVETVLALDAAVDAQDERGDTALHSAWRCGNARVTQFLIKVGKADPHVRNKEGLTAMECHPSRRSAGMLVVQGLVSCPDSCGPLCMPAFLRFLLDYGLAGQPAHACPLTGETLLHAFCASPLISDLHLALLECLLVNEYDPNVLSYENETPLFVAARSGRSAAFLKLLIDFGGDPSITCKDKYNSLQVLATIPPHETIGLAALILVLDGGMDLNDCGVCAHSQAPFEEQPVISNHPSWSAFWMWLHPPESEYELHRHQRECFQAFVRGEITSLDSGSPPTDIMTHPSLQVDSAMEPVPPSERVRQRIKDSAGNPGGAFNDGTSDTSTTISFGISSQRFSNMAGADVEGTPSVVVVAPVTHHKKQYAPVSSLVPGSEPVHLSRADYVRGNASADEVGRAATLRVTGRRSERGEAMRARFAQEHGSFIQTLHQTLDGIAFTKVRPSISNGAIGRRYSAGGDEGTGSPAVRPIDALAVETAAAFPRKSSIVDEVSFATQHNDLQVQLMSVQSPASSPAGSPTASFYRPPKIDLSGIPDADDSVVYGEALLRCSSWHVGVTSTSQQQHQFNFLAEFLEQRRQDYATRRARYCDAHNAFRRERELQRRVELVSTRARMLEVEEVARQRRLRVDGTHREHKDQ